MINSFWLAVFLVALAAMTFTQTPLDHPDLTEFFNNINAF